MVRVKFRYLVVNLLYPEPGAKSKSPLPDLVQIHSPTPDAIHPGILLRMIRDEVTDLYGDYGMGMISAGLKINYFSQSTSTAIIRCPRDHYEMVWAALTYITRLPKPVDIPVVMRIARVSGTIVKAEEEVIRRSQQIIRRARAQNATKDLPMLQSVQKAVDKENRKERVVLAPIDDGAESGEMTEADRKQNENWRPEDAIVVERSATTEGFEDERDMPISTGKTANPQHETIRAGGKKARRKNAQWMRKSR